MKKSLIFQLCLVGASLLILIFVAFAPQPPREQPTRIVLEVKGERVVIGATGAPASEPEEVPAEEDESDTGADALALDEETDYSAQPVSAGVETSYDPPVETNYQGTADITP